MRDLSDIPDALSEIYTEEFREILDDLIKRVHAGEAPKGALRVFKIDGSHEDICWGYESEDEKQSMLAMLEKHASGGIAH